jgi:hypothetical protein
MQITSTQLDNLMQQLVQKETQLLQAQQRLFQTELGQQTLALKDETEALEKQLKELLNATPGVQVTPHGKVGYQPRCTYTYHPAAIEEVLPQYKEKVIIATVDKKALQSLLPSGDKRWNLLNEHTTTQAKTSLAWQCQPLS